jgi:hypothetical protein
VCVEDVEDVEAVEAVQAMQDVQVMSCKITPSIPDTCTRYKTQGTRYNAKWAVVDMILLTGECPSTFYPDHPRREYYTDWYLYLL